MAEKIIDSRIQLKTDTAEKWDAVKVTFTPKKGEFIFYSDVKKFKVGDGSKTVGDLDFVNEGQIFRCAQNVTTFAEVTQALNEGRLPVLWDANNDWHTTGLFTRIRDDVYVFWSPMSGTVWDKSNGLSWKANALYATGYESTNGWVGTATYDGLDTRHVSTSVTSASKDTEVASAKAVYTAINNIATATTSAKGLMSSTDKTKLDGIATGANKYVLPTANSTTLGGVKSGSTVTSTSGLTACPIIGGVPYYKEGTGSGGSSGGTTSVKALTSYYASAIGGYDNDGNILPESGEWIYGDLADYDVVRLRTKNGTNYYDDITNLYRANLQNDADDGYEYITQWIGTNSDGTRFIFSYTTIEEPPDTTPTYRLEILPPVAKNIVAKYTTIGGTAEFPVSISTSYFFEIYNISSSQYGQKELVGWFTFENGQIKNSIGGSLNSASYDSTASKVIVGMGEQISGQYLVIQYPLGQGEITCIVENTSILIKDRSTNELTTKLVQDIKVGDELAFWSPKAGGLSYNKVIMPVGVGDCTAYNKVCFSDGSYVNVYGNQLFWDVDKDAMVSYKEMTTKNRVCKQDGTIVHFDHIEGMVSDAILKHYTIMTQYGKFIANGVQTGDKVELFYPRFQRDENLSYWMKLTDKQRQFYIDKYNDGLTRRNWFTSELYRETLYPLFKQKREQNKLLEEKQAYLDTTDYQVIKKTEGLLTDEEFAPVKAARQEARDAINVARARIAELEATIKEKEAEVKATIYGKRKCTYHNAFEGKTRAVLDNEEQSAD